MFLVYVLCVILKKKIFFVCFSWLYLKFWNPNFQAAILDKPGCCWSCVRVWISPQGSISAFSVFLCSLHLIHLCHHLSQISKTSVQNKIYFDKRFEFWFFCVGEMKCERWGGKRDKKTQQKKKKRNRWQSCLFFYVKTQRIDFGFMNKIKLWFQCSWALMLVFLSCRHFQNNSYATTKKSKVKNPYGIHVHEECCTYCCELKNMKNWMSRMLKQWFLQFFYRFDRLL